MSGDIFLQRDEDELVSMREAPYDSESVLQQLLAKFPDLLAGDQLAGDESRRWFLVQREVEVPDDEDASGRWSLDHLFLDQDAVPTLVEVKRSSDTRIRREVVGQLIDYAANGVVYWPTEKLRASFDSRMESEGLDSDAALVEILGPEGDADGFWEQAAANLKAGRIRLVFVADEIPRELRRVVEFLNEQMAAEVIAIEVKQYLGPDGLRTLVPRVIGQTAAAETRKKDRKKELIDRETLLDRIGVQTPAAEAAEAILDWAESEPTLRVRFTTGQAAVETSTPPRRAFLYVSDGGRIYVELKTLRKHGNPWSDDSSEQLVRDLGEIGVHLDTSRSSPRAPLEPLANEERRRPFFELMESARKALAG